MSNVFSMFEFKFRFSQKPSIRFYFINFKLLDFLYFHKETWRTKQFHKHFHGFSQSIRIRSCPMKSPKTNLVQICNQKFTCFDVTHEFLMILERKNFRSFWWKIIQLSWLPIVSKSWIRPVTANRHSMVNCVIATLHIIKVTSFVLRKVLGSCCGIKIVLVLKS